MERKERSEEGPAGVGIWIFVDSNGKVEDIIESEDYEYENEMQSIDNKKYETKMPFIYSLSPFILACFLIILMIVDRKVKTRRLNHN